MNSEGGVQFMLYSRIVWTAITLLSKKEKLLEKYTETSLLHLLLSVRTIRKKFFCFPCVTFLEKSWEYSLRSLRTWEDEIGAVKLVFFSLIWRRKIKKCNFFVKRLEWRHWKDTKGNEKTIVATVLLQGNLIKIVSYIRIHLNIIYFRWNYLMWIAARVV